MSYDPADFAPMESTCSGCQQKAVTTEMREDDNEDLLCASCFDDYAEDSELYTRCEECEEWFHQDQIVPVQGYGIICKDCAPVLIPDFPVRPQPVYSDRAVA